jgi:hypothetical protein
VVAAVWLPVDEGFAMRLRWIILSIGAVLVGLLFAFPLWWPLINVSPVAGALPGLSDLPPAEQDVIELVALENLPYAQALVATGLAEPVPAPESEQPMPALQSPTIYATGDFVAIDAVRRASGTVTVYQQADGNWLIRLENFEVRNGPQLHLFLSAHAEPRTAEEVRAEGLGLDWGPLKGTAGNQNYAMPAGFNMGSVRSVVIFALPYGDVFSTATLERR